MHFLAAGAVWLEPKSSFRDHIVTKLMQTVQHSKLPSHPVTPPE